MAAKPTKPVKATSGDVAEFKRNLQRDLLVAEVNDELTLYLSERNGLAVWRALKMCHDAGEPLPQTIYAKLAQWAERLEGAQSDREIARALEMVGDRKSYKGASHLRAVEARRAIASEVVQVAALYKRSTKDAIAIVARNRGLSVAKVHADYYKFFRKAPAVADRSIDDAMRAFVRKSRI